MINKKRIHFKTNDSHFKYKQYCLKTEFDFIVFSNNGFYLFVFMFVQS